MTKPAARSSENHMLPKIMYRLQRDTLAHLCNVPCLHRHMPTSTHLFHRSLAPHELMPQHVCLHDIYMRNQPKNHVYECAGKFHDTMYASACACILFLFQRRKYVIVIFALTQTQHLEQKRRRLARQGSILCAKHELMSMLPAVSHATSLLPKAAHSTHGQMLFCITDITTMSPSTYTST